ncbi:FG-GAP and VCBS repeat-containing protein [Streptomyces sp. NPDC046909]|uniref:FG-GAP and VCBS repeat-containing protein n=1 Tax=Streptomyces sp. NPDC046909 TaxID=3155617 RepID=UPI0033E42284
MSSTERTTRRTTKSAVAAASFLLLTGAGILAAPTAFAGVPGGSSAVDRNSDFNGDGYTDLVTGAPDGTVDGKEGAGYVTVQYGAPNGIGTNTTVPKGRVQIVSQSTKGVPGTSEFGDRFGQAIATGDLDGDGYDDLVVGAPGEDEGTVEDAGRVSVLYGSAQGLDTGRTAGVTAAKPTADARFGLSVAAARFSGDIDGDQLTVLDQQGLNVFTYHAGVLRQVGTPHSTGHTLQGAYLTTGDYDSDGFADLVVSGYSPDDDYTKGWSALYTGGTESLTYSRDLHGGLGTASGDINGDGYDDLVVGQRSGVDETTGEAEAPGGLIGVYYGGEDGPSGAEGPGSVAPEWWSQNSPDVPGAGELHDSWGNDLSVADVDGDGFADVAVGAPGEDADGEPGAGGVWLLRGTQTGLTGTGAQYFDQNTPGIPGAAEAGDGWGAQVRLVDTDGDSRSELVAAAPDENTGDGAVWILPASGNGLLADGSRSYGAAALGGTAGGAHFGSVIDE